MYRKIFRAISPKKDYRNVSSKTPPVFALKRDLQHFLSARFCNNLGLVLNPSSRPFMTSASGAIRGYQGREKAVCVNLQSPVWWKLFEWKQQSWSVGSASVQLEKKSVWENQPVEWIHQKIKESETLPLGWQYWAFSDGLQLLSRQSAWRPPSLPSFLWLGTDFWSRDLGWFGISHEVDSFLVLFFFSTFSAMAWNWTSSLRKKIHRSLVHGFCRDGSTLIGSAIWERNVLTHNPGYAPHQLD